MTKKAIVTLFFSLLVAMSANAGRHVTDTTWYNMQYANKVVSTKDSASFFLAILSINDAHEYPVLEFSKDHKLTSSGYSTTANPVKLNYTGEFTNYFTNGRKSAVAEYDNGKLSGKIIEYYPNGQLYTYRIHPKEGHILLVECRDSTGKIFAKDGNGKWIIYTDNFHKMGQQGMVKDSLEDGEWKAVITGLGSFTTIYDHGAKTSNSSNLLDVPHDWIFERIEMQPHYHGDFGGFLASNIRYPKYAKKHNIQGKVFVQFIVEKDGSVDDFKVLRSPDQSLSDEAVRVLQLCEKWQPGFQDDHAVRVMYTVPINFSLTNM